MFETEGFLQNSWVNHCWSYPGISCGTSAWIWKSRQRPWPKASHLAWHGGSQVIIQISSSNFAFFLPFWWGHRNRWWFSDIPRAVTKALRWRAQPLWSPEITGPNISGFPYSDTYTGWWFGTFFIFPNSWDDDPIWLIFFRGVGQPPTSIARWESDRSRRDRSLESWELGDFGVGIPKSPQIYPEFSGWWTTIIYPDGLHTTHLYAMFFRGEMFNQWTWSGCPLAIDQTWKSWNAP